MANLIKLCLSAVITILSLVVFAWPIAILIFLDWIWGAASGRDDSFKDRMAYWKKYEKSA